MPGQTACPPGSLSPERDHKILPRPAAGRALLLLKTPHRPGPALQLFRKTTAPPRGEQSTVCSTSDKGLKAALGSQKSFRPWQLPRSPHPSPWWERLLPLPLLRSGLRPCGTPSAGQRGGDNARYNCNSPGAASGSHPEAGGPPLTIRRWEVHPLVKRVNEARPGHARALTRAWGHHSWAPTSWFPEHSGASHSSSSGAELGGLRGTGSQRR